MNLDELKTIKAAAKLAFAAVSGVQGVGIGDQALRVYIASPDVKKSLPDEFQGVPVECVVAGDIRAQSS